MITPTVQELRSLREMNGEDAIEWIERMRNDCDVRMRNMKDDVELRQTQGWSQALTHVIDTVRDAGKMLESKSSRSATAATAQARF